MNNIYLLPNCGREAVTAKDGVGLGRRNNELHEFLGRVIGRVFKIEISKVSGSILAAEICTGSHNRLLRRQHCSSLCSQSEGHEHVANMTSALGHNFVEFSDRAWPPQYSPPSLCEQSELQCFASDLRQMPARCPLQRCRNRHVWQKKKSHLEISGFQMRFLFGMSWRCGRGIISSFSVRTRSRTSVGVCSPS